MSTYAYSYSYRPGHEKAERGFSTLTGAVRHLRKSVDENTVLSRNEASQVVVSAAHSLGEQVNVYGVVARICKESA